MKIAIDVRMITPHTHGISRYAYSLIEGLSTIDKKNDYVLVSNDTFLQGFVSSHENFSLKLVRSKLYGFSEQITIPRLLNKNKIDIFHSPSFFGPVLVKCKVIMTIHDMIHVLFPGESSALHRAYYSIIVRRAATNASRILTVSESSKRDISNYLNIPSEKIIVTFNAVDKNFRRSKENEISKIKNRFGINDKYILYVGSQKPHKNVGLLIDAYHQLRGKISHQLVIVGKKDRLFQKGLKNHKLDGVIIVGGVSDEVLPHLYSGADVFVSPSLFEGFGLPLIEAFACETPVVAIKTSSVDEILGDAGLIVDLNDPEALADAIYKVLSNDSLRDNLIEEGLKRKDFFSWEDTAERTLKIYEEVFKVCPSVNSKRLHPIPLDHRQVRRMRVGINASRISNVHTGVGRYAYNVCKSILRTDNRNEYFLYSSDQTDSVISSDMKRVHKRKTGITFRNNLLRILWEQIALPFFSVYYKLDLYHFTDHALSLLLRTHPTIITVHDIAFIRFPHLFNKSRQVYKKYIFEKSIKKADFIVVPSSSTKKDILHYYRIEEKRIRVVYNGIESRFRPINNVEEYRRKKNLPSKMILNVGTLEPRKNIVALIKAFEKLRERGLNDYSLVIAGGKGWLYKQILEEIKNNEVSQSILYLDVVKDEDLPVLYNCADIFVYPSLYEGFGLPPLEAMACGVPVITSNTSSLPEVVGDAGIMVNPTDVNSLCDNMYNLLSDKELKNCMRIKGLERSKLFSWEKAAKDMLGIYNELCSKTSLLK